MDDMEDKWLGLDAALHELGMLSVSAATSEHIMRKKLLERQRIQLLHNHRTSNSTSPVRTNNERPLQPSQAWNVPEITGGVNEASSSSSSNTTTTENWSSTPTASSSASGWSPTLADNENNENTFSYNRLNEDHPPAFHYLVSPSVHRQSCPGRLAQLSAISSHGLFRQKPYTIPWRVNRITSNVSVGEIIRVRTKSENADSETQQEYDKIMSEMPVLLPPPPMTLFRSRSLEDVRSPSDQDHEELDEMSKEIERLQVNE